MNARGLLLVLVLVTCSPAQLPCSADLQTDSRNCGACGMACAGGTRCEAGTCVATCAGAVCDGRCVDTRNDPASCGACGNVCAPVHASAACAQGGCSHGACEADWFDCDGDESNGCESQESACRIDICGANDAGGSHFCDVAGVSADGQKVLFFSNDPGFFEGDDSFSRDLFLLDVPARRVDRLLSGRDGGVVEGFLQSASLAGDGRHALFAASTRWNTDDPSGFGFVVHTLDVTTRSYAPIDLPDASVILTQGQQRLSHDGRLLVSNAFCEFDSCVVAFELETGAWQIFTSFLSPSLSPDGRVLGLGDEVIELSSGERSAVLPKKPDAGVFFSSNQAPEFSFDAGRFAFATDAPVYDDEDDFFPKVRLGSHGQPLRRPDGGSLKFPGSDTTLSYDGRVVALSSGAQFQAAACVAIDVDTEKVLQTSSAVFEKGLCSSRLSGDGRWLLVSQDGLAWLLRVPRRQ